MGCSEISRALRNRCLIVLWAFLWAPAGFSQLPTAKVCRVEAVDYQGWQAQQLSNRWVQLIIVPQNGGRLMQVIFAGHSYLFVNPLLAGK